MVRLSAPRDSAPTMAATSMPNFAPFEPTTKVWKDCKARFDTFAGANFIPARKMAQVFLINQTPATYRLLDTLVGQQQTPKVVDELTMGEIQGFM